MSYPEYKVNTFAGKCKRCGHEVPERKGLLSKNSLTERWEVHHRVGDCPAEKAQPAPFRPVTKAPSIDDKDAAVDKVIDLLAAKFMELVPGLVEKNLDRLSRVAKIQIPDIPPVDVEMAHSLLPTIVTAAIAGISPFLVGPAGSGKTTLAQQVAEVLDRKFYCESRVTSEFKLIGFIDAAGHVVRTQFREAYEHGGVFLFDEVDASDPDALTAFNSALANGYCAFPDQLVNRHSEFVAIAAGNTYGRGADRQYVGRTQLDAATIDRFAMFECEYDEHLELQLGCDVDWTRYVQSVRAAVAGEQVRHIVSPRASIQGGLLLAAGVERHTVEEAVIWKGLDRANRDRVTARLNRGY